MENLLSKKCTPAEEGTSPLTSEEIENYLAQVSGWAVDPAGKVISKDFKFKDFSDAMTFANKIAEIAEKEEHHPDLMISWGKVGVALSTHSIGGLSENDFILAAKIDAIL